MKKTNSLKGKKLFEAVYNKGKRVHRREIQLIYMTMDGEKEILNKMNIVSSPLSGVIKIGIPINRKYGNSVIRNRAKRRIRAICREILQEVNESYLCIIRPKVEFKSLNYMESKQTIKMLFKNAGILRS